MRSSVYYLVLLTVFISCITTLANAQRPCQVFNAAHKRFSTTYGSVAAGGSITIPAGQTVWFDTVTPVLNRIDVLGTLVFDPAATNLKLNVRELMVQSGGLLQIGCQATPFTRVAEIVLYGSDRAASTTNPGTKVIWAAPGGAIELWGSEGTTWTQLASTAALSWNYNFYTNTYVPVGASQITVVDDIAGWRVGDKIVVASSDFDGNGQNEVRGITAVSGKTITLDSPLTYMHYGSVWRGNGADQVDMRAEVGHLTRFIKISGDISDGVSDNLGFGGHTIYYPNSTVRISGVEFFRMGQQGVLARYPVHWHMARDTVVGSFVQKCSIHDTYQRAITVHFTNSIVQTDNVAYNISGHAYFLEDACESNNTYTHNLAVGIFPIRSDRLVLGTDLNPAGFWITFPTNKWINNVAVGGAFGYWFSLPTGPTGPAKGILNTNVYRPMYAPLGTFSGNKAHGCSKNGLHIDEAAQEANANDRDPADSSYYPRQVDLTGKENWPAATVQQLISNSPVVPARIVNFTAYKCINVGAWGRGSGMHLTGAMLADNQVGASFPGDSNLVENSVFVGETENVGNPWAYGQSATFQGRTRFYTYSPAFDVIGYRHYDCCGPDHLTGSRFYNFQNFTFSYTGLIRPAAAISVQPGPNVNPGRARQTNLSFFNTTNRFWVYKQYYGSTSSDPSSSWACVHDTDGYLTQDVDPVNGGCGAWIVANNPILVTSDCKWQSGWNSWICKAGVSPARRYFSFQDASGSNIWASFTNQKIDANGLAAVSGTLTRLADKAKSTLPPGQAASGTQTYPRSYQVNLVVNQEYLLQFGNGSTPRAVKLYGYDLAAGNAYSPGAEWVKIAIPYPTGTTFVIGGGYDGKSVMTAVTSKAQLNTTTFFYDAATQLLWLHFASTVDSHRWDYGFATRTNNDIVWVTATCPGNVCGGPGYAANALSTYTGPAATTPFLSDCSVAGKGYANGLPAITDRGTTLNAFTYSDGLNPTQWVSYSNNWWPRNNITTQATIPAGITGNPIVAVLGPYGGFGFGLYWNFAGVPLTTETHFVLTARAADGFGPVDFSVRWTDKNGKEGPSVAVNSPWYLTTQGPLRDGAWFTVAIPLADLGIAIGATPKSIWIGSNQNRNVTILMNNLKFANLAVTWGAMPNPPTTSTGGSTQYLPNTPPVFRPQGSGGSFEKFASGARNTTTNNTVQIETGNNKSEHIVAFGAGGVAGLVVAAAVLVALNVALAVALVVVLKKKSPASKRLSTISTEGLLEGKSDITL